VKNSLILLLVVYSLANPESYLKRLTTASANIGFDIARGKVPGVTSISKFGNNPAADSGEDVWGGGGLYTFFPKTAKVCFLKSTSVDDDSGGSGAISVIVFGLDSNWKETQEMVTLNGVDSVELVNKYIRINTGLVYEVGGAYTNLGDIDVWSTGTDTVGMFIQAGDGRTQLAIYTIPAGKTGYLLDGFVALTNDDKNGQGGTFQWLVRENNGVNRAWLVQGEMGLINIGSSNWQRKHVVPPGPFLEKTDIRVRLSDASATMQAVAGFDLILVED